VTEVEAVLRELLGVEVTMKIDIMLEPDQSPEQISELALLAENYGLRALWAQNYVSDPEGMIEIHFKPKSC